MAVFSTTHAYYCIRGWQPPPKRTQEPPLTPRGGEAAEAGDTLVTIPLDHVASVKSAESAGVRAGSGGAGKNAFMIITPERTWLFRAMARQDMQEWLFSFHRSLAVIVARLLDSNNHYSSNNGGGGGGAPGGGLGLGGLGSVGGYHRYGMGAGGLLSSRNDTNLMASRRGLRFVEEQQHLGHGHGRSLSVAQHRLRQVGSCLYGGERESIHAPVSC